MGMWKIAFMGDNYWKVNIYKADLSLRYGGVLLHVYHVL